MPRRRISSRELQYAFSQTMVHPMIYSKGARESAAEILANDFPEVLVRALLKKLRAAVRKEPVRCDQKPRGPAKLFVMPAATKRGSRKTKASNE